MMDRNRQSSGRYKPSTGLTVWKGLRCNVEEGLTRSRAESTKADTGAEFERLSMRPPGCR